MTAFEFTDRYQALGIPYPEPETVCEGQCEGTGHVPVYIQARPPREGEAYPSEPEDDARLVALWNEQHRKYHGWRKLAFAFSPRELWRFGTAKSFGRRFDYQRFALSTWREACDGWHFVKCPDCGGSGRRGR